MPLKSPVQAKIYLCRCIRRMPTSWFAKFQGLTIRRVLERLAEHSETATARHWQYCHDVLEALRHPGLRYLTSNDIWAFLLSYYSDDDIRSCRRNTRTNLARAKWPSALLGELQPPPDEAGELVLLDRIFARFKDDAIEEAVDKLSDDAEYFRNLVLEVKIKRVEPDGIRYKIDLPMTETNVEERVKAHRAKRLADAARDARAARRATAPPP